MAKVDRKTIDNLGVPAHEKYVQDQENLKDIEPLLQKAKYLYPFSTQVDIEYKDKELEKYLRPAFKRTFAIFEKLKYFRNVFNFTLINSIGDSYQIDEMIKTFEKFFKKKEEKKKKKKKEKNKDKENNKNKKEIDFILFFLKKLKEISKLSEETNKNRTKYQHG